MLNIVQAPTVTNRLRHVAMPQFDTAFLSVFQTCHFHDGFVKSFALCEKHFPNPDGRLSLVFGARPLLWASNGGEVGGWTVNR